MKGGSTVTTFTECFFRADSALTELTIAMLKDPKIIDYMTK